jgi:hypothetical protein
MHALASRFLRPSWRLHMMGGWKGEARYISMPSRYRRMPDTNCPKCGSKDVRPAKDRGLVESLVSVFGLQAARCHNCAHRYLARPFGFAKLFWAKCPRCYRMDLSTWDPKYYHVRGLTALKLTLGANRWRCEACRCNFASFRPRQRKYLRPEPVGASEAEQ